MKHNWSTERIMAVTRIVCTLAASVAAGFGLALDADMLYTGCAALLATICYVWIWWSNNNMTEAAQEAQKFLNSLKASERLGSGGCAPLDDEEPLD